MKDRKLILVVALCLFYSVSLLSAKTKPVTSKIPKDLVQQLIKDINHNKNNSRLSVDDLQVLHRNLKYELHDLNGDGVQEFFLYIDHSDWCGAGGNCSYWIYQRTNHEYTLLLEDKVLRVRNRATNGYKDLASEVAMGFCAVNIRRASVSLYRYDGKQYQLISDKYQCIPFTPNQ
ncbi:MAG: hypothetical protein ACR2LC_02525 [Pyrinomonadaceae bacterium]